ncbi:endonuclease/exonuclease/phosphatase family protein [Kitasatospora sp. NBC_00374]|uniref:endonuclease/exonuclease/phosphatase family protein n=1 Tax=Kitasatospora sp. NBC_00374 TaxID=2975964 RepID=UPI003244AA1D
MAAPADADRTHPGGAVRVATFNVLHGRVVRAGRPGALPPDGRAAGPLADAVASLDADVLALQEVDHLQDRSGRIDQARAAAEAAGAVDWRYASALHGRSVLGQGWVLDPSVPRLRVHGPEAAGADGPAVPSHGLALLSRLPVLRWRAVRLSPAPAALPLRVVGRGGLTVVRDRPRVALAAVLAGRRGPFTAVALHLSFVPGWNVRQLLAVRRWIAAMPLPHVLLGDLNLVGPLPRLALAAAGAAGSGRREVAERLHRGAAAQADRTLDGVAPQRRWQRAARGATYPAHRPMVQLDHVLVRGVHLSPVRPAATPATSLSDHRPLVAELPL